MATTENKKVTQSGIQFLEIKDTAIIARMINVSVSQKIPITIWLKSQALKFDTIFASYYQKLQRLFVLLPPEVPNERFLEAIAAQGSREILGSFQVQTMNFFFKTQFVAQTDDKNIQVTVPKEIYKLQRRKNLRIAFPRRAAPKLSVFDPRRPFVATAAIGPDDLLAFRILDVSAGGLAFAAKPSEKDMFQKGQTLNDMRFSIRGMEIAVEGIVAHAAQIPGDQGKPILKVGVKFQKLKSVHEKHIIQFVMEESAKLFSLIG